MVSSQISEIIAAQKICVCTSHACAPHGSSWVKLQRHSVWKSDDFGVSDCGYLGIWCREGKQILVYCALVIWSILRGFKSCIHILQVFSVTQPHGFQSTSALEFKDIGKITPQYNIHPYTEMRHHYTDGFVQDCNEFSALAMELL